MSTSYIRFLDELEHYKSFLFLKNEKNRGLSSEKPWRWSAYLWISVNLHRGVTRNFSRGGDFFFLYGRENLGGWYFFLQKSYHIEKNSQKGGVLTPWTFKSAQVIFEDVSIIIIANNKPELTKVRWNQLIDKLYPTKYSKNDWKC